MLDTSCLVLPIPAHAFFEQAVLQGEIGHHLLQGGGFTTKLLPLAGRRGAGSVARQPALARLQELLRPAIIHRGGNALAAAQLREVVLAAQSFQHNADLLFRRVLPTGLTPNLLHDLFRRHFIRPGFLLPLSSLRLRSTPNPPSLKTPNFSQPSRGGTTLRYKHLLIGSWFRCLSSERERQLPQPTYPRYWCGQCSNGI